MKDIRKWSIVIQNSLDINKGVKLNCWQFMGCIQQKKRACSIQEESLTHARLYRKKDSTVYMAESTEAGHAGL